MAKQSRAKRWAEAAKRADKARDQLQSVAEELTAAMQQLEEIQSEFSEWRDNLPENLQSSMLGEKLNTVCDMDIQPLCVTENILQDLSIIDEALNADLPLGFGRD